MLLTDLLDAIKVDSGQTALINLEWDESTLRNILSRKILPFISKYYPFSEIIHVVIKSGAFIFTTNVPKQIISVKPVDLSARTADNINFSNLFVHQRPFDEITLPTFLWKWRSPILYVEYDGDVEVTLSRDIVITSEVDSSNTIVYTVSNLEDGIKSELIDLCVGHLLLSIGRSRRGANFTEMQIELDSADLVTEGNDLIVKAQENIMKQSKSHFALRM